MNRPPIGASVRVLRRTSVRGVSGRRATVFAHHGDGTAIVVRIDFFGLLICDPTDVAAVAPDALPYVEIPDETADAVGHKRTYEGCN